MALSWLRRWRRRFFPSRGDSIRRPASVRPALTSLEDRLLLSVTLNLIAPSSSSGVNSVQVQYTNTGTTAVAAPVLILSADNANLWLPNDPADSSSSIQLLATNPNSNGPAGKIAPGATGTIEVDFAPTSSSSNAPINFHLGQLTAGQPIDWASLESSMRPSSIPAAAWNAVFTNFTTNVGSTTDSYQAALDADATYLGQLGEPANDVAQLLAFEIRKADDDFGAAPQGSAVDLSVSTPGPSLSFSRSFQPTISGRNEMGLTGLGWVSNWDISASSDTQGNITIDQGGSLSYFSKQSGGSYLPLQTGSGTLTALSGGGLQLTAANGSITAFNANGTLNYVQDANGNRVSAGYNSSGQMVSLTASNGDALTFAYNNQGLVSQITDPSGETADYTYDAAGHLLSVTTAGGTTNYSYVTGTGTPADNALQTIFNSTGTQLNYTYDNEGRLTSSSYGTTVNPYEPETIRYTSPGGISYTDADNNTTTILYTELGQPAVITDALGNSTYLNYDANGNLTSTVMPNGATYAYTYNALGNLTSTTNALGYTTQFNYDTSGNLTGATDAKGNSTTYSYNSQNELLSVTYANGAQQEYTYNPLGEATQFLNANNQAINYSYNNQGQITGETFANGTSYAFTYDIDGNLTSATDAQGNITHFIYGGDPNNPNNPDLLTEVEYPDGTYLKFSYYAGGLRAQSVDQTGYTVNYTYDAAGRLSKLTDANGNLIVQYTYDPAGNVIQQDNGNGTRTVFTYDADGNLLTILNLAPDHVTVNSFDKYTYDVQGNVTSDANRDGQWVYSYDANGELTKAVFTPNNTNPDGLTAQNIQYFYDADGNLVSEIVNGVTTTYTVNNVNEDTSSTTAGATTDYQYDWDGNLIAQTTSASTTSYTYDALNELTGISGAGLTASYAYNPLGNRVSQTVNGVTTNFQVDPAGNVVAALSGTSAYNNSGGLLAHYTSGLGLVSQVTASGSANYYDFGLTGNTTGITNAAGSYVDSYSYLPFGQTTAVTAALSNPFTFAGQSGTIQDGANLFDIGTREYSATTTQYLSGNASNVSALANPLSSLVPAGVRSAGYVPASPTNGSMNPADPLSALSQMTPADFPRGYRAFAVQFVVNGGSSASVSDSGKNQIHWVDGSIGYSNPAGATQSGVSSWNNVQGTPEFWTEFSLYGNWNNLLTANQSTIASPVTTLLNTSDTTSGPIVVTTTTPIAPSSGPITVQSPRTIVVYSGPINVPITTTTVQITPPQSPGSPVSPPPSPTKVSVQPGQTPGQYIITATVSFPMPGNYGINVIVNGNDPLVGPGQEIVTVFSAPPQLIPASYSVVAGGQYLGTVADFIISGANPGLSAFTAWAEIVGSGVLVPATIVAGANGSYLIDANLDFGSVPSGITPVLVGVSDSQDPANSGNSWMITDDVVVLTSKPTPITTTITDETVPPNGNPSANTPLVILDTNDPTITSPTQVSTVVGTGSSPSTPTPVVTGITVAQLTNGLTQIIVQGWVQANQLVGGMVKAAPLTITVGNESPQTTQVQVNEPACPYILSPTLVKTVAGQSVTDVQVATLSGAVNSSYSATIQWGDGETSTGVINSLGNGLYSITGSKPHPYASAGSDTITVTVNSPGVTPAAPIQTSVFVTSVPISPPPSPPPSPPSLPSSPPPPPPPATTPVTSPPPSAAKPVSSPGNPVVSTTLVQPASSLTPEQQMVAFYNQIVAQIEAEIQSLLAMMLTLESEMMGGPLAETE